MRAATSLERRLAAFLPRFERERIAGWTEPPTRPERIDGAGAVLFADLAGFTALTRRLAEEGAAGAERLSRILDATFGRMVGMIEEDGGDVILFAGDALLAAWTPAAGDCLQVEIARAAACGGRIVEALDGCAPEPDVVLRLRASVAAGPLSILRVGGVEGRWRFLIAGPVIAQLSATDAAGSPGHVLLSSATAEAADGRVSGTRLTGGQLRVDGAAAAPPRPTRRESIVPPLDLLRSVVPRAVAHRLEAGHDEWLGEFRALSLLFAGMELGGTSLDVHRLHACVAAIQDILGRYRGSIYSLAADDKGTALIAAFGMPPLAVQDTAARAVGAALEIRDSLQRSGAPSSIGVTTGLAFCGGYGGLERRHYAIVGPPINLAARLMKSAAGGILCDEATRSAAVTRVSFGPPRALRLKGFDEAVRASAPVALRSASRVAKTDRLVGRATELRRLDDILASAGSEAAGSLLLEGEAGLGKSTLLGAFVRRAAERDIRVLSGGGDSLRDSTLYFAWRAVLEDLLPPDPAQRAATVRTALGGDERLLRWAPLLSAIAPVGIPDNATSREITGEARAHSVQELMVRILEWATRERPTILLLEDAHWFDSPSYGLIHAVARRLPSLPVVLSSRPHEGPMPPELAAFCGLDRVDSLRLQPLGEEDIPELIALALGADRVPDELVAFVRRRAECHPFHSTELVRSLRDRGLVEVTNGSCRIRTESGDLEGVRAPASVQEVVLTRVDQLAADQQLILKTASVIGRTFGADMLADVFPVREARGGIQAGLDVLVARDMIQPRPSGPTNGATFEFRHAIIADVVYGALLFSQRRELHRSVAEWYEHRTDRPARARAPLLAHHWDCADVPAKALGYLETAGADAVAAFSNREAVRFLTRAVELDEARAAGVEGFRRAEWERNLAEARIRLSQYDQAKVHLHRSLALRGLRVHRSAPALGASLLWHLGVQGAHRLVPRLSRPAGAADGDRRSHGAKVYKRVAEVAYFENDKLRLLHATLAALNMAESCGAIPEQVNGYGSVAIVADLGGMRSLAERYMARAVEVAERSGRPSIIGRAHLLALIRAITHGHWERARVSAERGREMFARIGDAFRWETCTATYGYGFLLRGDLGGALGVFEEAAQSARQGAPQTQTWARVGQLAALLQAGEDAAHVVHEVERLLEAEHQSRTELLTCSGILARAYLADGKTERAREAAEKTLAWLDGEAPAVYYPLWSIAGAAEVFLSSAAAAAETPEGSPASGLGAGAGRGETLAAARSITAILRAHARMFPICVPTARRFEGRLEALQSRPERALALWREGAERARALDMRAELALLERSIAQTLDRSDPSIPEA